MERSDALIKTVSVLAFIALVVYIAMSFFADWNDPLQTYIATDMELRDGANTTGYFVRDESVITASGGSLAFTAAEGEKLSSGQTLAVRYVGSAAMERAKEINDIQQRIRQLTAIRNGRNGEEMAASTLLELSRAVTSGKLSELYSIEQDVDAYIISGSALSTGSEDAEIERLKGELERLANVSEADTVRITAPFSGTFSLAVDGFEGVGPEALHNITPSSYRELFSSAKGTGDAAGKLIRGIRWYYVTELREEDTAKLRVGSTARLNFSRTYSAQLDMTVRSVSTPENGRCVAIFSSDSYMQDVTAIREAEAEIVFDTISGVSVPRGAVHLGEERETFVYVLRGLRAVSVPVNIIAESGDYYILESTREGLRANDIVILRADNLYDGAVVER